VVRVHPAVPGKRLIRIGKFCSTLLTPQINRSKGTTAEPPENFSRLAPGLCRKTAKRNFASPEVSIPSRCAGKHSTTKPAPSAAVAVGKSAPTGQLLSSNRPLRGTANLVRENFAGEENMRRRQCWGSVRAARTTAVHCRLFILPLQTRRRSIKSSRIIH
jgi:hypothetical protein